MDKRIRSLQIRKVDLGRSISDALDTPWPRLFKALIFLSLSISSVVLSQNVGKLSGTIIDPETNDIKIYEVR